MRDFTSRITLMVLILTFVASDAIGLSISSFEIPEGPYLLAEEAQVRTLTASERLSLVEGGMYLYEFAYLEVATQAILSGEYPRQEPLPDNPRRTWLNAALNALVSNPNFPTATSQWWADYYSRFGRYAVYAYAVASKGHLDHPILRPLYEDEGGMTADTEWNWFRGFYLSLSTEPVAMSEKVRHWIYSDGVSVQSSTIRLLELGSSARDEMLVLLAIPIKEDSQEAVASRSRLTKLCIEVLGSAGDGRLSGVNVDFLTSEDSYSALRQGVLMRREKGKRDLLETRARWFYEWSGEMHRMCPHLKDIYPMCGAKFD